MIDEKNFQHCRLDQIHSTEKKPYNGDVLNREKLGKKLQHHVELFTDNFVMALNGKWGSGKTTFIDMWQQQMINEGYITIYYNSWKNDYISDPLIGLIAEFKKKMERPGKKPLKKFANAFRKVSLAMVPSLVSLGIKSVTGLDLKDMKDAIEKGTDEVVDIINDSVDSFIKQQKSIENFKEALTKYVEFISPQKRVIFIIDELDRCKPDFAVKTLECIKHLFSVKNVLFVLAIDREQLGHSIRGYYGSDLIDADDYLRRFIDIQINLPQDHSNAIVKKVLKRFSYSSVFLHNKRELEEFELFIGCLYGYNHLSIRQLEKWMLQTRLAIDEIGPVLSPEVTAYFLYLYNFDINFYNRLLNNDLSDNEVLDHLVSSFPHLIHSSSKIGYVVIATVLKMKYHGDEISFHQRIIDKAGVFQIYFDRAVIDENDFREAFNSIKNRNPIPLNIVSYLSGYTV